MRPASTAGGDRRYPERPIVGVGAVVVDGDGRVLLVKRERPPLAGEWSLPGGCVEAGEGLDEAVRREVLEETGLVVEVSSFLGVVDRRFRDAAGRTEYHYVLLDYRCRPTGGSLLAASDARDVAWAHPSDLVAYGLAADTHDMIDRAFRV